VMSNFTLLSTLNRVARWFISIPRLPILVKLKRPSNWKFWNDVGNLSIV
jgi:hypothetical protein